MYTKYNKLKEERLSKALKENLRRRKNKKKYDKKNIVLKSVKIISLLIIVTITVSCNKKIINTGYHLDKSKLQEVKISHTTEQNIINRLGRPTTQSIFGPKTYFYMEQKYQQFGFWKPRLIEQMITAFEFDSQNFLVKVGCYHISDANNVQYDPDYILIKGNKMPILEQLIGNVGKYYPTTSNSIK